jgi:Cu-Zn family superoxide dismutase
MRATLAIAATAALAGCAAQTVEVRSASAAEAEVRDVAGRVVARSRVAQIGNGVRIRVEAAGLAAGTYGAHVHAVGRCESPAFESAGPHWNPTGTAHGRDNPQGQHLGDLPNLVVGTDGRGSIEFSIPAATFSRGRAAMLDVDGAAIVIHARPDDYRTDPSGNSGTRIACGVFR